ncbi:MAG: M20/M25/M40 family metallo-hydrolase [Clostridiaceae bacterium]|nr:M20/M25/M40 family metallo-hydrolase [Clostridiaceae bacterium]
MIVLWCILGVLAALLLICILRAALMKPTAAKATVFDTVPDARAHAYGEKLGALIRCETVSEMVQPDKSKFYAFHEELERQFPLVHQKMEKTVLDGSLLFSLPGGGKDLPPVLLMSHHDVVEAPGAWRHPPFSGEIADGRVWGRGTLDTKGSLFCILQAAEELLAGGWQPPYDFYIASACTEETLGTGAKATAAYLKEKGVRLGLLIDEGGMVLDAPLAGVTGLYALVGVLEKGYGDLRFTAAGNGGHSSMPAPGTPIPRLAAFVHQVETHDPFTPKMNATVREMLRRMAPNAGFGMRVIFGNLWLFSPLLAHLLPVVSPLAGAMVKTTIAFTTMQGSSGLNVVPERAYVTGNLRFIHHQGADESIARMTALAKRYGLETEVITKEYPCAVVSHDTSAFRLIERCAETCYPGVCVTPYAMTGGTDAKYYNGICDNCLRFAPLYCDGQQLESIHGRDENLYLAALPKGVDFYKSVLAGWPAEQK